MPTRPITGASVSTTRRAPCNGILAAALLLIPLLPACRSAARQPDPVTVPPVFFDERRWADDAFGGKSVAQVRALMLQSLDTPVTVSFRAATLNTVARELSRKTGIGIGITPDVQSGSDRLIDLDVRDMPARHVLEWVARLAGACYAVEGSSTVFITRDPAWASRDRLEVQNYPVGAFARISTPVAARYDPLLDAQELAFTLRDCLRHVTEGHENASIAVDQSGQQLTASLPPRGHAKLRRILEELKRPREYEPPRSDAAATALDTLLNSRVTCSFPRQDVRRIADELALRAGVNIGFDYRLIPDARREIELKLGETTLARALEALAAAAALGDLVPEPDRAFWFLARGQDRSLLRSTGLLPWDRAVVRSIYVKPLVDQYGLTIVFDAARKAAARGRWLGDIPDDPARQPVGRPILLHDALNCQVVFYHRPTGRLVALLDDESQRLLADAIDRLAATSRPVPPPRSDR